MVGKLRILGFIFTISIIVFLRYALGVYLITLLGFKLIKLNFEGRNYALFTATETSGSRDLEYVLKGKPILLVCPGGTSEPSITTSVVEEALLKGYNVIAGLPSWGGLNVSDYNDNLRTVLKTLADYGVDTVVLFGHSMGAHRVTDTYLSFRGNALLIIAGMTYDEENMVGIFQSDTVTFLGLGDELHPIWELYLSSSVFRQALRAETSPDKRSQGYNIILYSDVGHIDRFFLFSVPATHLLELLDAEALDIALDLLSRSDELEVTDRGLCLHILLSWLYISDLLLGALLLLTLGRLGSFKLILGFYLVISILLRLTLHSSCSILAVVPMFNLHGIWLTLTIGIAYIIYKFYSDSSDCKFQELVLLVVIPIILPIGLLSSGLLSQPLPCLMLLGSDYLRALREVWRFLPAILGFQSTLANSLTRMWVDIILVVIGSNAFLGGTLSKLINSFIRSLRGVTENQLSFAGFTFSIFTVNLLGFLVINFKPNRLELEVLRVSYLIFRLWISVYIWWFLVKLINGACRRLRGKISLNTLKEL